MLSGAPGTTIAASSPVQAGGKNSALSAAMSGSVSRSSNPNSGRLAAAHRDVAHLFLVRKTATLADRRRTDEASRPDCANCLPGHPASFVRSVRTVGSPQSCSGARYRRSDCLGSIPWPKPSRSRPTIQVLFLGPGMWRLHGSGRNIRARATPARSCFAALRRKPRSGENRRHGVALAQPQFQHEDAFAADRSRRVGRNRPITIEAVGPAVERAPGIEVAHLGLQASRCRRARHRADWTRGDRTAPASARADSRRPRTPRGPPARAPRHCRGRNRARRG